MVKEDSMLRHYKVPAREDLTYLAAVYTPISAEERKRRVTELNQRVKDNVTRIQSSAEFRNFLIAMSRFHDYSWNNQMLIWLQKPDATHVAGFNTWRDLRRWVKKGEKGIAILAPLGPAVATTWTRATDGAVHAIRRSEEKGWDIVDGNEVVIESGFKSYAEAARRLKDLGFVERKEMLTVNNFKVVHVFDISQTEGKPLPEFEVPVLTGEMNQELFDNVIRLAREEGVQVSFDPRPGVSPGVKGSFSPPNQIWVKPDEPPAQQLKTLLHELAHYYSVGVFRIPKQDAETIAESAAYIVGAHYGFDTGVRSFPYVALWARDEETLKLNMKAVQEVSERIIETMEKRAARLMPRTERIAYGTTEIEMRPGETPQQAATRLEAIWGLEQAKTAARRKGVSTAGSKRDIIRRLAGQ